MSFAVSCRVTRPRGSVAGGRVGMLLLPCSGEYHIGSPGRHAASSPPSSPPGSGHGRGRVRRVRQPLPRARIARSRSRRRPGRSADRAGAAGGAST